MSTQARESQVVKMIFREEPDMKYLIGVDVGTSATKTVLFDEECRPVAEASAEYPMYQPQNG